MKGTGVQEALKSVTDLNQWYLKQFLVRPDVFVARSSFKSYYLQNLKRRGLSTDIDWNTHEIDMDAAEYAQAMIDRQQNISDPMLAGEFLSSDDPIKQIARKVILPFASFILNQKARMYNDIMTISSKTTSRQDKIIAYRSLTGLATELATYQMIGFGIRRLYDMIAASLLGDDDDEETKKKKIINATKYPIKSIVNDIFSPIPMTDRITTWGLNQALAQYPWMTNKEIKDAIESRNKVLELKGEPNMTEAEENEFIAKIKEEATYQVFEDDFDRSYGMIGIAGSTYQELGEIGNLATTGEFTDEYQGRETTKKLLESDREKVKYAVPFMIAYSTGLLPKDVGSIGRNYVNRIKKKAITEKQFERYDAVQKDLGRNLKSWEVELVKAKKESETAVDEVKFIERNGGLTERQGREYLKLMKAIGEPSVSDIVRIKEGQTADQILK
jgi:bacterioferritin (cytochrome b1)